MDTGRVFVQFRLPMSTIVKICGLTDEAAMNAALDAGADMVGLVQFARSPRHIDRDHAGELADRARGRAGIVLVTVDMAAVDLDLAVEAIRPDWVQCHGAETPERVAHISAQTGCRTIKAIGVAEAADLDQADAYAGACDLFLLDARAPKDATRPGGHGQAFDWRFVAGRRLPRPYLLSGGLSPDNVADAVRVDGAAGVDVSSGVERAPGRKDPELIAKFVAAARVADPRAQAGAAAS